MKPSGGSIKSPCLDCLECCKNISYEIEMKGPLRLYEEFATVRGLKISKVVGNRVYILIPLACPHLTNEGCEIYEFRPEVCRIYDGRRDPALKEKCKL